MQNSADNVSGDVKKKSYKTKSNGCTDRENKRYLNERILTEIYHQKSFQQDCMPTGNVFICSYQ